MDIDLKKKVIKTFVDRKKETLKSLLADQERKLSLAGQDNIESKQIESRNDAAVRELDFLNRNIDTLGKEIEILEDMPSDNVAKEVGVGALVKTDKATFLVGVAQESMDVEGQRVAGISMASPIYDSLKGESSGAKTKVNDTTHEVMEIV